MASNPEIENYKIETNAEDSPDWTPPTLEERVKLLEEKMTYTGAFIRSIRKQKGKEAYYAGNNRRRKNTDGHITIGI